MSYATLYVTRRWQSGQMRRTVNPLTSVYVGSNPTRRTILDNILILVYFLLKFLRRTLMTYIYHAVPLNMTGTVLYPLNQLKGALPELYKSQAKKYKGRECLMEHRIPLLDCLWNDVLFLTAVHPSDFRTAFESVGFPRPRGLRSFQFDISTLDHSRMGVLTDGMGKGEPGVYEPFNPTKLEEYATIPEKTFTYWYDEYARGTKGPFRFLHIPHILYQGTLDTRNASVANS